MRSLLQQCFAPRCPQCGKGKLVRDMLGIVDACGECGFVLEHHDSADGPTFFAIIIIGFMVTGLAAVVEFHYQPPLWLHAALWVPFTVLGCIIVLRIFKTLMITIAYRLALLDSRNDHD